MILFFLFSLGNIKPAWSLLFSPFAQELMVVQLLKSLHSVFFDGICSSYRWLIVYLERSSWIFVATKVMIVLILNIHHSLILKNAPQMAPQTSQNKTTITGTYQP